MAIDKDKLLAAIEAKSEGAYGSAYDGEIARKRAQLIEAYLGLNTNPAPEGRSQIVDRAVFETVQTTLPSLVRIFAGSEDPVKFVPVGPEDEPSAEQTTGYINHLVCQKNPWEQICADWIHDALLLPNGYVHVYWDLEEHRERETYEGQTDEQLAVLLQDEGVEVIQHDQEPDEEENARRQQAYQQAIQQYQMAAQQAQMQMMGGQPPQGPQMPPQPPQPAFLHDVVIERVSKNGGVRINVLPPENCLVASDTPDWTLNNCEYFEFRTEKTLASLRAMLAPYGVEVPDDISDVENVENSPEEAARNRFNENSLPDDDRKLWVRTIWVKCAAEDDDERYYYVIAVGKQILYAEPTSRVHAVSLVTQPLPHRHPGMSLAEMVKDVQDIKTAIKRGALDNMYLANSGRFAISDRVNLDDFLDSRPGGVVRLVDGALPGEGHIFPLTHPFAFGEIVGSLEYFDQDRQNVGGVNRYFSGTDAGAINKTASGTMALQNMSAQRVEHIARMMAPAFETLFNIVQELVAKHQNKAEIIKLRGDWVNVDPTAWKTRRDCKISVGVGAGNKDSMLQALAMQIQMQMALAPAGVARPENIYESLIEQSKLQGFANPQKFWTDPRKNPPQPQVPPEIQVEQMRLQADQQKFQAQAHLDQQKMAAETQKAQQDAALKMELEKQKVEQQAILEKYKADLQAQTQLQMKQMELGGNIEIKQAELGAQKQMKEFEVATRPPEQPKDDGKEELKVALQAVMQAVDKLGKPKRIVRDEHGRVAGVESVG